MLESSVTITFKYSMHHFFLTLFLVVNTIYVIMCLVLFDL